MSGEEISLMFKTSGNEAYKAGRYEEAIDFFSKGIEVDAINPTLFCNRAMSFAALHKYDKAVTDAFTASSLNPAYEKAYFWLVRCLLKLNRKVEARKHLLRASEMCNSKKNLKSLENEYFDSVGMSLKPCPNDFEISEELGEGNFSRIFKVTQCFPLVFIQLQYTVIKIEFFISFISLIYRLKVLHKSSRQTFAMKVRQRYFVFYS
jgi:tetratricopeptide (TPR) repeat protein